MEVIWGVGVGLLLAFASLSWGCLAGRLLPEGAELVHRWALGLALLAAGSGALAVTGCLYPIPLFLLAALPVALKGREASQLLSQLRGLTLPPGGKACVALLVVFWGAVALGALAPNTHWDVEMYHYTLPRLYLAEHRLYWTGTSIYDGVFQFTHMLYLPALSLGGEVAANLWGPLMLVLLCLAAAAATRSQEWQPTLALNCPPFKPPVGAEPLHSGKELVGQFMAQSSGRPGRCAALSPFLAMLLVCTSPVVFLQGYGGLMDLPAALWCMLALDAWLRSRRDPRWTFWLAIWCGLAVATKVTAGLSVLSLGLATLFVRDDWKWKARAWGLTMVAVLLLCAPWMCRNWAHTRAPIYPLGRVPVKTPQPFPPSTPSPSAAQPWLQPYSFGPSLVTPHWRDRDWQQAFNPCLLTALLLTGATELWLPGIFTICLATCLGVADHRYALGGTLWLVVPASIGLTRAQHRLVWTALAATCLVALTGLLGSLALRLPVVFGMENRPDYLTRIDPLHTAYDFLARLPHSADDRIWLMDPRGYHCPLPFLVTDHASGPQSWDDLGKARWVLWNFSRPAAASQLAFWTLRELGPGIHLRERLGILALLPDRVLGRALRVNGATLDPTGCRQAGVPNWPIPIPQKVVTATRAGRAIYHRELIVIVEIPTR